MKLWTWNISFELNKNTDDDDYQNVAEPFTIIRLKCQGKKLQSMDYRLKMWSKLQHGVEKGNNSRKRFCCNSSDRAKLKHWFTDKFSKALCPSKIPYEIDRQTWRINLLEIFCFVSFSFLFSLTFSVLFRLFLKILGTSE